MLRARVCMFGAWKMGFISYGILGFVYKSPVYASIMTILFLLFVSGLTFEFYVPPTMAVIFDQVFAKNICITFSIGSLGTSPSMLFDVSWHFKVYCISHPNLANNKLLRSMEI